MIYICVMYRIYLRAQVILLFSSQKKMFQYLRGILYWESDADTIRGHRRTAPKIEQREPKRKKSDPEKSTDVRQEICTGNNDRGEQKYRALGISLAS